MKVIVGLGNPGVEYANTRHNAGILFLDKLVESLASDYGWRKHFDALIFKTSDKTLVKTKDIFMNESGRLLQGLPEGDLYLVHDDLDIKLGEYKIQKGVGPKVHNGVESVENKLGSKDFWRIRIGIDNRDPSNRIPGEEYVLQKFSGEELGILSNVFDAIIKAIN